MRTPSGIIEQEDLWCGGFSFRPMMLNGTPPGVDRRQTLCRASVASRLELVGRVVRWPRH